MRSILCKDKNTFLHKVGFCKLDSSKSPEIFSFPLNYAEIKKKFRIFFVTSTVHRHGSENLTKFGEKYKVIHFFRKLLVK